MEKTKVLLQCQSITYFYMGLAAVYTKYNKDNVIVDVLFTKEGEYRQFFDKLKSSKYTKNIYHISSDNFRRVNKRIFKLNKNLLGKICGKQVFEHIYKKWVLKIINKNIESENYSDIFFSHEVPYNLITYLKYKYTNAKLVIYGDGSGLLMGKDAKLIDPYMNISTSKYVDDLKPDEVISLSPYIEDSSIDINGIPICATDNNILKTLITEDENFQKDLNEYTNSINKRYGNIQNKYILLTSRLNDPRFMMSEKEQIQIYVDIIRKYCIPESLVILKLHPTSTQDLYDILNERLKNEYTIDAIPTELKELPIEICSSLVESMTSVISFLSSSKISLKVLYDIDTLDAKDVIKNYNLIHRVEPMLDVYSNVVKNLENWNRKSVIYTTDIIPKLKEFYDTKYKSER